MNMCSVNTINFGARVQFDNNRPETKMTLPQKTRKACGRACVKAKHVFIIPVFFSAILSRIIKVKKSIRLPS